MKQMKRTNRETSEKEAKKDYDKITQNTKTKIKKKKQLLKDGIQREFREILKNKKL